MKNILLTLSVLLMAIMFMGTSFVVATDHAGLLVASGSKSNVNGVPFAQASVTSNAGYGKYNSASVRGYLLKENIGMNAYSGPTDKVIQNITVGIRPHAIAFDSSNGNVYVTNCGSDGVSVIDGSTNKVIQTIAVGKGPVGVAFDSSNGNVYVSNHRSSSVSVIDASTNKVIQNITVGSSSCLEGIAFDSSNRYVYVVGCGSGSISVIDGSTNKVIQNITVGESPNGAAYDSSNGNVYVTNGCSSCVSVIDGSTNKVIQNITVGNTPVAPAFDSSNGNIYVPKECSRNVSVINGSTNKVIQNITVGESPNGAAYDSSNGNVYVANCGSNNVSVINGSTNKVIQNIAVGSCPAGVAFDSLNGHVYVASSISDTVSVLGYVRYAVTFTEAGLPSGSDWYMNITGHDSGALTGTTYSVNLTNGTFVYTIQTNNKLYEPSTSSGSLMINGSAVTKSITFFQVSKITFTETGLPSGTVWYVNVTNSTGFTFHGNSSTNTITFNLINGTYSFLNSTSDKIYEPSSYAGTFTVSGTAVNLPSVTFSKVTYKVTFTETGLPSGTTWYANVTNSIGFTFHGNSSTNTITFNLINGTYSFLNSTSDKIYEPSSYTGTFTVSGTAVNLPSVTFSKVTYKVTFTETGLPTGSDWYVNITGQTSSGPITGTSYSIYLANASYSYNVQTSNKIYEPSHSNSFTVNGNTVSQAITFSTVTYKVTFTETGLPTGSDWYVNITGHDSGALTGVNYSVMLTNGTYAYTIGTNNTNYNASNSTVIVNGHSKTVTITFTSSSSPSKQSPSGISSMELYGIIGAAVAVIIVGSAVFMIRKKK